MNLGRVRSSMAPEARWPECYTLLARLQLRQHDSLLALVLAFFVPIAGLTRLVALKKQNLTQAFIGIDAGRQRRRVGDLQRHKAFPFGLKWRDVHDDAAARVS